MRYVKSLGFVIAGLAIAAFGMNSEFWTRNCSDIAEQAVSFVFGNACHDRAFGFQMIVLCIGLVVVGFGFVALRNKKR